MEKENITRKKLSIIIPCYNEEEGINNLDEQIKPVLEELERVWTLELIFVDDGSTDKTNHLLHKHFGNLAYVKIITHDANKNLGAAMRTGFSHATGDVILTSDSDCTYPPREIPLLLELLDSETDIVTASPYHTKGQVEGVPEYRLFLSRSINRIYNIITREKISTYTALFRAQRKKVVDEVTFKSDDFLATAETLVYALLKGYKVKEYPTTLHVRKYGVSQMKLFGVIKSHAKFVFKLLGLKLKGQIKK